VQTEREKAKLDKLLKKHAKQQHGAKQGEHAGKQSAHGKGKAGLKQQNGA
jgi:hypothetical protein